MEHPGGKERPFRATEAPFSPRDNGHRQNESGHEGKAGAQPENRPSRLAAYQSGPWVSTSLMGKKCARVPENVWSSGRGVTGPGNGGWGHRNCPPKKKNTPIDVQKKKMEDHKGKLREAGVQ